jgi:signal peptidase I
VFVLSASVFIVVYLFLMQPHQVKGNSMVPNFHDGEYLLTDKVTFRRRLPIYGDVVVFKAPVNENYDFIKRVIAIPGEKIMIKENRVYLNDQILDESAYLPSDFITRAGQFLREGVEFSVPEGTVFVLGDNRDHSSDSREWGPVPLENIVGKTFFRYWPPETVGLISNP